MGESKRYKRGTVAGTFLDDNGNKYTAEEILKQWVGDTKIYTHYYPTDRLHVWFFEIPQKSDYQNYFAQAGKMALVIELDKVREFLKPRMDILNWDVKERLFSDKE